jgi:hypothetical protein
MTPIQTFGANAAPSNMQFPTAAYLQASQNAAEMQARGMGALGQGLAGGIDSAMAVMQAHKEEQAKFNATKKMFGAFSGYLDDNQKKAVDDIFADTTMSIRDKNALAPALMQMLGAAQQQKGKERIVELQMGAKAPRPAAPSNQFDVGSGDFVLNRPLNPPKAQPAYSDLPVNPSQGNPGSLISNAPSAQDSGSRVDPNTGMMQFWSPSAKRWVDEELYFNPQTLGLEPPPR